MRSSTMAAFPIHYSAIHSQFTHCLPLQTLSLSLFRSLSLSSLDSFSFSLSLFLVCEVQVLAVIRRSSPHPNQRSFARSCRRARNAGTQVLDREFVRGGREPVVGGVPPPHIMQAGRQDLWGTRERERREGREELLEHESSIPTDPWMRRGWSERTLLVGFCCNLPSLPVFCNRKRKKERKKERKRAIYRYRFRDSG